MRVQLEKTVRYKPYRMARIRPLMPERGDNVHVDALVARIRDLVSERVKMGFDFPFSINTEKAPGNDDTNNVVTATATGNKQIGKVIRAAATTDTTVRMRLSQ